MELFLKLFVGEWGKYIRIRLIVGDLELNCVLDPIVDLGRCGELGLEKVGEILDRIRVL
jgi:hypothetical protein